jgi:hypothetical protein
MALTVTDVVSEFGAYYRNEGQGVADIMQPVYQPSVTLQYFNPLLTTQTQERRSKAIKSRTLQRYQKAFTPIGGAEFKACKIDLAHMKVDEKEIPGELEASWLGFLANLDTNDRLQWPFTKWWMSQVLQQTDNDFELLEAYKGAEGSVTPGTATAAGESMDGLEVQITDGITATDITPVNSNSSWSTDPETFVVEIEDWIKAVAAVSNEHTLLVENDIDHLFFSKTLHQRYLEGLRVRYNLNFDATGIALFGSKAGMPLPVVGQNISVVGLPSMAGKNRVFMTPKENRAAFRKKPQSATLLGIESEDRSVKIFGDIWIGLGFWYKPFVFTNQLT